MKRYWIVVPVLMIGVFLLCLPGERLAAESILHYVKPIADGDCSSWAQACELETALVKAEAGDEIWVSEGVYKPGSGLAMSDFTFVAWVNWKGGNNWQRIFDFGQDTSRFMMLTPRNNTGELEFAIKSSGQQQLLRTTALSENVWRHLALTLHDDTGHVYIDGTEVVSGTITFDPSDVAGSSNWLGKSHYPDPYFNGIMDEAAVFQRALTPAQITAVMNDGWDGMDGLVMGFHMDEDPANDNTTISDSSGLAYHAMLDTNADGANKSTTGHIGQAIDFDGTDDFIYLVDHRSGSFRLKSGVAVYGGFDGTESSRDQRNADPDSNNTVLSGDVGLAGNQNDNSYHVVTGDNLSSSTVLDGFSITGGNANGDEFPEWDGGGMLLENNSDPILTHITFAGNSAEYGGGLYNRSSSPALTNVTFKDNSVTPFSGFGGGIYNNGSNPTLANVSLRENSAENGNSGGMHNLNSSPTLTNVSFYGNIAVFGPAMSVDNGSPTLTNVTVSGHSGHSFNGGAVQLIHGGQTVLVNSILWGNTPRQFEVGLFQDPPVVTYSIVEGGWSGTGNINQDPLFVDAAGGDLRLELTSPAVDAGDDSAVPAEITTDLAGHFRKIGVVDMGAYEAPPELLYVDADATGEDTGLSWADAFVELQAALTWAVDGVDVWVAEGSYYPDYNHVTSSYTGKREASFHLVSGGLYGGFDPDAGDDTLEERDWINHVTTLSGDIGITGNSNDNAYHVAVGIGLSDTALVDGFTITGGNANGDQWPYWDGGGMLLEENSQPALTNLIFSSNAATWGGGLCNRDSSPKLTNVTLSNNKATTDGGGISNYASNPTLEEVAFIGNAAGSYGGGMHSAQSRPALSAVTFSANSATYGGGIFNNDDTFGEVVNTIFQNNLAHFDGGGMYNLWSSPALTHVIFRNNIAWQYGGGMVNSHKSPSLVHVIFDSNTAYDDGGGIFNWYSNPFLNYVQFKNNQAYDDGGGMRNDHSTGTLRNVVFEGNRTLGPDADGGGLYNFQSYPQLYNTLFHDNHAASDGGGICNNASAPTLTNVTFNGNSAFNNGGGILNAWGSTIVLRNAIVWGNNTDSGKTPEVYNDAGWNASNCIVRGGISLCSGDDPLFVDAAQGDLRLQLGSPAIDWGEDSFMPYTTDLGGHPRIVGEHVDLGAYEAPPNLVYVDQAANGNNTGLSWPDAFVELQSALTWAVAGVTVNVAQGSYLPDYNPVTDQHTGDIEASFQLGPGVAVYGGFDGTEADLEERDLENHVTVLSGDIDDNDLADASGVISNTATISGTNSYHVVVSMGATETAVLDGFTITGGNANGNQSLQWDGGGMLNENSSPTLSNLIFAGNAAIWGGGLYNHDSSPGLIDVTFNNNKASEGGGGMVNDSSAPTLSDVIFSGNATDSNGGGMVNSLSSPLLSSVTFSDNTAAADGGGIWNIDSSSTLTDVVFSGNTAVAYGGAIHNENSSLVLNNAVFFDNGAETGGGISNSTSSLTLTNVTLNNNQATSQGGALANLADSDPVMTNSVLWGNSAPAGAEIFNDDVSTSTPAIAYSLVQGSGGSGPSWDTGLGADGGNNLDVDPLFVDAGGGDLRLTCTSPAIDMGDNNAVAGIQTDLAGNPRIRGAWEAYNYEDAPAVDMGAYEEQYYANQIIAGTDDLVNGRGYRTGFHATPDRTIEATIGDYSANDYQSRTDLEMAAEHYINALACAPTADRQKESVTGRLEAHWELATGEMLVGNEAMVQSMDMRFVAQYPTLADQIDKIDEARESYTRATIAYLELLAGDFYTETMQLQPDRPDPWDVSSLPYNRDSLPYADVQRLAEASAKKSLAYVEQAERQFRLYTPDGKAAAEATLREGFDLATAELTLLEHLAQGWTEPSSAYQVAYQTLAQNAADMQRLFGYLQEGKNPFGYAEDYVPFMPIELGVEYPDPNFVRWYDRAKEDDYVSYDYAEQKYNDLMLQQRELDDDQQTLGQAMQDLSQEYGGRLVDICGADGSDPDLAGCHLNEEGTMSDQLYAIQQAEIRVQAVQLQMENQLTLIRIEQQRAAQVAGIHRATAVMYTETGDELASLARQEVELEQSSGWCDMLGGIFGGAWSSASAGMAFGPWGAVAGGALGGLLEVGKIIEAEATAPEMDLADIEARREEIKAYQQAQVEYAEAEIEDANSEALIKQYMLEYAQLKLDLAMAINQLQQEIARLEGMKSEVEYLLARWNEANRDHTTLYSDPAARILRDMYAEEASQYFEAALESAYLAGQALDYEMAEAWPGQDDVYGLVNLVGSDNLEGHLAEMYGTYEDWFANSPQTRDTAIKLSEAMGFVDSEELVDGVPVLVTAQEKFNRYVSDPTNWTDRDHNGTPESLELTFQTTILADPPQFFANTVYNDKIRFFYIVLRGDEQGLDPDDNDTYVMLRQEGTTIIRNENASPLTGDDSFRQYNLAPTRNYGPKAIYNRKPDFQGDVSYRSHGLFWRSVSSTKWVLTIDRAGDPANDDLDLAALDEIEVYISQRNFPLPSPDESGGADQPIEANESTSSQPTGEAISMAVIADGWPGKHMSSINTIPDSASRYAGTVTPEHPLFLPQLELALYLEETGGTVEGWIEAEGLLGYPVLTPASGRGPTLHGSLSDGQYLLVSDPFLGASGNITRQVMLTTTTVTTSSISGQYVEKIQGLSPQDLAITGAFTLTLAVDQPVAGFNAIPSAGPAPLVVQFLDWSRGNPNSWAWDFGDGATSTEQNPIHTYDEAGTYTVTLTVSSPFGTHTLVEQQLISVTEPAAPVAHFSASPRSGVFPLEVQFTDLSAGGPTAWDWDFGDGGGSAQRHPTHTYLAPGTYTVTLSVSNDLGSDSRMEEAFIVVTVPVMPVAAFSATPDVGNEPLTVQFTDLSSGDPTSWDWDFGDGATSGEQHPSHIYTASGSYTVTLTVTNAVGSDTLVDVDCVEVQRIAKLYVYLPTVMKP